MIELKDKVIFTILFTSYKDKYFFNFEYSIIYCLPAVRARNKAVSSTGVLELHRSSLTSVLPKERFKMIVFNSIHCLVDFIFLGEPPAQQWVGGRVFANWIFFDRWIKRALLALSTSQAA